MILGERIRLRPIEKEDLPRQDDFRDGVYRDTVWMGLLRSEWEARRAAQEAGAGAGR